MTLTEYPQLEQGSDSWLAARCGIVTASVVGQLLTPTVKVADNDKSRGLTAQLVAERLTGWVDPTFVGADMMRGIEDEPRARDLYSEKYAPATELGFMVKEINPGVRLGYSPDGLVGDDGLIEVKSRLQKKQLLTILTDRVPVENVPQLQAGLLVSGREWIDYVSFCSGMPMYVKRVEPDPVWFEAITDAVTAFECDALQMVAIYRGVTEGLWATERPVVEPEMRF